MARAATFAVIPGGRLEQDGSFGAGKLEGRVRADRAMTDLSRAFALDIDQVQVEAKWPLGRTFAFVLLSSVVLWALIVGPFFFII